MEQALQILTSLFHCIASNLHSCAMTNFIPIFPLGIVVYPGEQLNLHIFEPRYKQLINECYADNKPFGIPTVIENRLQDYGTVVSITEITTVYDDGEMDIKTKGNSVFRILEVIKEIPDKLYSGAIVNYPHNHEHGSAEMMRKVVKNKKRIKPTESRNLDVKRDTSIRIMEKKMSCCFESLSMLILIFL